MLMKKIWQSKENHPSRRTSSWNHVKKYGYPTNKSLPHLEEDLTLRSENEIVDRTLTLNVVAAIAFGFDRDKAIEWLESEQLLKCLSPSEHSFIINDKGDKEMFKTIPEALFAFIWILGKIPTIKFDQFCDEDIVLKFPNLKSMEQSNIFRHSTNIRPESELLEMLDLTYCLHWGQKEFFLAKGKYRQAPYIIEQRRKSFEWAFSANDWDEITLDT